ncbi:MAG: serine--tRNA ligase [Bifidobacteriaceae bacterium]|nr:serine--tRNA ligase [Bifidobacteriaceae bacterium]
MIDLKALRDNPEQFRASQNVRGEDPGLVDQVLAADQRRREALASFETKRAEQKAMGGRVAKAKGDEKKELIAASQSLAAEVKAAKAAGDAADAELNELAYKFGNLIQDGAPAGGEDDYVVVREVGEHRDFAREGFEPRPHEVLGEMIGAFDTTRGAKVGGSRFYYLTGVGARLELALLTCAVQRAVKAGFTPMITPTLVRPEIMQGTGFLGEHNDEVYYLPADDLYLTGTSEVALAGFHAGEIIDLSGGPRRYTGWSACYRREAGSYGKDTKGIFRVHQFHKVEMFSYCDPAEATEEHQRLLGFEEEMLQLVGLPYRVIDVAGGDLGSSAARKFDCEAWIPTQGRYREMTSTSNCTTFQSRRLNIRQRVADGGTEYVATLNGTLATTRWIVALLENNQRPDGSVVVPEPLRDFMGIDVMPVVAG